VSGGVDSLTCALLMRRAIGERLHCLFIDNGLLREGEADQVETLYRDELGFDVMRVNAQQRFMERLQGIADPIDKRHIIRSELTDILSEQMRARPELSYYVLGTIYSDLLTGGSSDEVYARRFDNGHRLEPVRMLFKDEIRILGELLGLSAAQVNRQSFPTPALAVRCVGEVTPEKLKLVRQADAILREEIQSAGVERKLSQFFVVLTDSRTLGRRDGRYAYEYACAIRAVSEQNTTAFSVGRLPYDLLDRVASRIIAETPGINRVVYDISPDDYTAIEWE
jgi:GMP synthase (glutamine-hydrolysing)